MGIYNDCYLRVYFVADPILNIEVLLNLAIFALHLTGDDAYIQILNF